jgi:hypothetical protein
MAFYEILQIVPIPMDPPKFVISPFQLCRFCHGHIAELRPFDSWSYQRGFSSSLNWVNENPTGGGIFFRWHREQEGMKVDNVLVGAKMQSQLRGVCIDGSAENESGRDILQR